MTDPYFERMLKTVVKDLWLWNAPTHFAVMGLEVDGGEKERAKRLRWEYGVEVVFYDNQDGKHAGLESLISEICNACNVSDSRAPIAKYEPRQAPSPGTPRSWMAKINARTRQGLGSQ